MDTSKKVFNLIVRTLVVAVALALVSTVYSILHKNDTGSDITFTDTQISFSDAHGNDVIIFYSDIVSIELLDAPDYGDPADGTVENKIRIGTWESSTLGTYIARTSTEINKCLLIHTGADTYLINYESDETTTLLLEELRKYI